MVYDVTRVAAKPREELKLCWERGFSALDTWVRRKVSVTRVKWLILFIFVQINISWYPLRSGHITKGTILHFSVLVNIIKGLQNVYGWIYLFVCCNLDKWGKRRCFSLCQKAFLGYVLCLRLPSDCIINCKMRDCVRSFVQSGFDKIMLLQNKQFF